MVFQTCEREGCHGIVMVRGLCSEHGIATLEAENRTLREQVETLTRERDSVSEYEQPVKEGSDE